MMPRFLLLFLSFLSGVGYSQSVLLSTSAVTGTEAAATAITITATASAAVSGNQTVTVAVSGNGITATDYTLTNAVITILAGQTVGNTTLTVANDPTLEGSEILTVTFSNPSAGITLGATISKDHMIFDNDFVASPVGGGEIKLSFVSSYLNVAAGANSAEISAYDPTSKRLFIANSIAKKLNIVNFSNPAGMSSVATIDVSAYGGINGVAVKNGIVAVAIEAANLTDNGSVVFYNIDGVPQKQVTVGAMPDMITFSPSGNLVLTANEGEPSDDYTVDPEGTVSMIDISGGIANLTQANVTTANFNSFDAQLAALKTQGIRIYGANGASVSKDLEPEYITFSADGNTAFVTLQENNAIGVLNIASRTFTAIRPLGLKDHNVVTNGLDASDQGTTINIANLPVKGMYQPDAIASFVVNNETYLVTANEGDSRVYPRTGTATFNEEIRVGAGGYVLDPTVFPNAALLKNNAVLGRLQLTNKSGDIDNDGDFDEIHALGARSFSIWKPTANALEKIFDSGDQFERITAADPTYASIFNASNDLAVPALKNRSDNKGPEPEGVAVAVLNGKTYAFIALERIGGVMVYNITNPASPVFVQWINSRGTTAATGDLGAEGIFYIPATESPTGVPLVVVSNENSSTVSVFAVETRTLNVSGTLAFGDVIIGEVPPSLTVTLSNTGNSPLTISAIALPSGFTSTSTSVTLQPNATAPLTVIFTPTELISYSGDISVTSNATSGPSKIAVSGTGISITGTEETSVVLDVAPNPSTGRFLISSGKSIDKNHFSLVNSIGREMNSNQFIQISEKSIALDLTSSQDGLYLVRYKNSFTKGVIRIIKAQ